MAGNRQPPSDSRVRAKTHATQIGWRARFVDKNTDSARHNDYDVASLSSCVDPPIQAATDVPLPSQRFEAWVVDGPFGPGAPLRSLGQSGSSPTFDASAPHGSFQPE